MPIFDQGYQHWSGSLSGHAWRWLAIARHGMRVSVRAGKASRSLRIFLLVSALPALGLAAVLCLWGLLERNSEWAEFLGPLLQFLGPEVVADPRHYRVEVWTLCYHYFLATELTLSMILVLLVGPNLISQDLRYNAMPLYFSRPLRRIDYFAGKLGVIVGFLSMVIIVPSLIAYVLGLLFSLDITIVGDTIHLLFASVTYGLIIAVSAGLLMLALSSLSRNSRYISLLWIALWVGSGMVSHVLEQTNLQQQQVRQAWRASQGMPGEDFFEAQLEASRSNWRPLVSYTANLARIGQELLGTDDVWRRLSELQSGPQKGLFLVQLMGPQYPWYWSAAVLIGLLIISLCILNFKIKSLDRLK
jgi:ABC-2 type transport system permease protein